MRENGADVRNKEMAVVVKTNGNPFWGRCTTHFRTYFCGELDVHWGYGILTHGQIGGSRRAFLLEICFLRRHFGMSAFRHVGMSVCWPSPAWKGFSLGSEDPSSMTTPRAFGTQVYP